jgi:molecular chaperone DnaJ
MRSLYQTLEVGPKASAQEIKRAYHRVAHLHHPDKNPGDTAAEERFKEATRAYSILSNPALRRRYDLLGPAAVGLGTEGAPLAEELAQHVASMIAQFLGRRRRHGDAPQEPTRCTVQVDLATALVGGHAEVTLPRRVPCQGCRGSGAASGIPVPPCARCGGAGTRPMRQGLFTLRKRCPECGGAGRHIADPCSQCAGSGRSQTQVTLRVAIPAGAQTGTILRLRREPGPPAGDAQEVHVQVQVSDHPAFERHGDDVHCTWPLTMVEAALGCTAQIPLLDGTTEHLAIAAGTQHGHTVQVPGRGAPRLGHSGRGALHVQLSVEVPQGLEPAAQAHLQAVAKMLQPHHLPLRTAQLRAFKSRGA